MQNVLSNSSAKVPDRMQCMTYDLSVKVRPREFGSSPIKLQGGVKEELEFLKGHHFSGRRRGIIPLPEEIRGIRK